MFYNYDKRMNELSRIDKISNDSVKEKALLKFIATEITLLQSCKNPLILSQALNAARHMLAKPESMQGMKILKIG